MVRRRESSSAPARRRRVARVAEEVADVHAVELDLGRVHTARPRPSALLRKAGRSRVITPSAHRVLRSNIFYYMQE